MTITKKATLLVLALVTMCAIALAGCGSSGASANSATSSSSTASSSAASAQQADEQAQQYVGTWKADKLTLQAKTNASDKETELDVPITVELNDDMTGTFTVGESTQGIEWEVRYWDNLKIERAVFTLHETFEVKNLECDPENFMLELADSGNTARLFYHWTSSTEPGVKLGIDTMVEKAS